MPSLGQQMVSASGTNGREWGFRLRVKQSCRLLNSCLAASLRSNGVNQRHTAIDSRVSQGLRIWLYQPTNRVSARRGTRLVNRKLRSSCSRSRSRKVVVFIGVSKERNTTFTSQLESLMTCVQK